MELTVETQSVSPSRFKNVLMHCDIVSGLIKGDVHGAYTKRSVSVTSPKCWKNSLPEHCDEA